MGSTPAARAAGIHDASSAAKQSSSVASASMFASQGFTPNQVFTISVRYKPSTSQRVQGALKISYSEQLPTPTNGVMPKPTLAIPGRLSG